LISEGNNRLELLNVTHYRDFFAELTNETEKNVAVQMKILLFEYMEKRKDALESQMTLARNTWKTVENIRIELEEKVYPLRRREAEEVENDHELRKKFEGLETLIETTFENENFQLIEEMITIIHVTGEISLYTVGNFDFYSRKENDSYIGSKIERLFKTLTHEISNLMFGSIISRSHLNMVELATLSAIEFIQNLKAVMEGQEIFVEAPRAESMKKKSDFIEFINRKLGGNDELKEIVRKIL
jgi:hypothetical protein